MWQTNFLGFKKCSEELIFALKTACLFRNGNNKYFWVCITNLLILWILKIWVWIYFPKLHCAPFYNDNSFRAQPYCGFVSVNDMVLSTKVIFCILFIAPVEHRCRSRNQTALCFSRPSLQTGPRGRRADRHFGKKKKKKYKKTTKNKLQIKLVFIKWHFYC